MEEYEYDLAVSFAREDTSFVEATVRACQELGFKVFYYHDKVNVWLGRDFLQGQRKVYGGGTRYVVPFISQHYLKDITTDELRAALSTDVQKRGDYILPLALDDTRLPADLLLPSVQYIRVDGKSPAAVAGILYERVHGSPPPVPANPPKASPPEETTFRISLHAELTGSKGELFSVAFSRSGSHVAAGSEGEVLVWQLDKQGPTHWKLKIPRARGEVNYVYSVAFSLDGRFLVAGGQDGRVRVWDMEKREMLWQRERGVGHTKPVYSVAFSPNGRRVASGGYDGDVKLWDAGTGQIQSSLQDSYRSIGKVSSICFSPDGGQLAIGSLDDTVTLWNIRSGERLLDRLGQHDSSVETVAFSPDGRLVASAGLDKQVCVWDVATKELVWHQRKHEYVVKSVSFFQDGTTLVSASWDMTVRLWDAKSGDYLQKLPVDENHWHTDWIWSVAFSQKGMLLASGGSDGTVMLWACEKVAGRLEAESPSS